MKRIYMVKKLLPPIHPGELLRKEFMEPLSLSASALASAVCITVAHIKEVMQEKRGITADMALRLSRYFGNSAGFWLNLQQRYEWECTRRESEGAP
jgi:addiction module HigA family antidote